MKRGIAVLIVLCVMSFVVIGSAETGTADKYMTMLKKLNDLYEDGRSFSKEPHLLVFTYSVLQLYEYSLMYDVAYAENDVIIETGYGTMGEGIKDAVKSVSIVARSISDEYHKWINGALTNEAFEKMLMLYVGMVVENSR